MRTDTEAAAVKYETLEPKPANLPIVSPYQFVQEMKLKSTPKLIEQSPMNSVGPSQIKKTWTGKLKLSDNRQLPRKASLLP